MESRQIAYGDDGVIPMKSCWQQLLIQTIALSTSTPLKKSFEIQYIDVKEKNNTLTKYFVIVFLTELHDSINHYSFLEPEKFGAM